MLMAWVGWGVNISSTIREGTNMHIVYVCIYCICLPSLILKLYLKSNKTIQSNEMEATRETVNELSPYEMYGDLSVMSDGGRL